MHAILVIAVATVGQVLPPVELNVENSGTSAIEFLVKGRGEAEWARIGIPSGTTQTFSLPSDRADFRFRIYRPNGRAMEEFGLDSVNFVGYAYNRFGGITYPIPVQHFASWTKGSRKALSRPQATGFVDCIAGGGQITMILTDKACKIPDDGATAHDPGRKPRVPTRPPLPPQPAG